MMINKTINTTILLVALSLTVGQALQPQTTLSGPHRVTRVADGDTLTLERVGSVRLIGIDAPESWQSSKLNKDAERTGLSKEEIKRQGKLATAELKKWVQGQSVWLELDVRERDKYGRVLGYIYRELDGGDWDFAGLKLRQVNLEMARSGFVDVFTIPPTVRYSELYVQAVREAREAKQGLWK